MKLQYDYSKSIYVIHKDLTKAIFLTKAKVRKDSYAESMFSRIYDCIHSELIDLELEYERYYKPEYSDIFHFLYYKYNLTEKQVDILYEMLNESRNYRIFRKEDNTYGDYGIEYFAFSESMKNRITSMLLMKEETNEN